MQSEEILEIKAMNNIHLGQSWALWSLVLFDPVYDPTQIILHGFLWEIY